MLQSMISRKGKLSVFLKGNNAQYNYGSFSFTLPKSYKECIIVCSNSTNGNGTSPANASVTNGTLTVLGTYSGGTTYGLHTCVRVYKGNNISGTLKVQGAYSDCVTIVDIE